MHELKIPKDRVAVLVGTKGSMKRKIEKRCNVKLDISKEGDVVIEGEDVDTFNVVNIIKAIGRGFNPDIALSLTNENNIFELINIEDFSGKSKKKFTRIKARMIGSGGRSRKYLEKITNTNIVVYGKTVSIIGRLEDVYIVRRGIEKLLNGAPHGNVYKFITEEYKKRVK